MIFSAKVIVEDAMWFLFSPAGSISGMRGRSLYFVLVVVLLRLFPTRSMSVAGQWAPARGLQHCNLSAACAA